MAGGPILPRSAFPITAGSAFAMVYDGAGATEDRMEMLGVSDATAITGDDPLWHLVFSMPQSLPTGTAKLRVLTRANATTGVVGLNIKWASVAATESPDDETWTDEGSLDITTSATADRYAEGKINLDGETVTADEVIHLLIEADDSAHTVAADIGLLVSIIWE